MTLVISSRQVQLSVSLESSLIRRRDIISHALPICNDNYDFIIYENL